MTPVVKLRKPTSAGRRESESRQMTGSIRRTTVGEVMTRDVVTVGKRTKVSELKELFDDYDFNAFPVVEDGRLVGIVTKLDFMRIFSVGTKFSISRYRDLFASDVGDIMRELLITVSPKDSLERVVEYMVEFGLRSIPVAEGGVLVGMVSRRDVLKHLVID